MGLVFKLRPAGLYRRVEQVSRAALIDVGRFMVSDIRRSMAAAGKGGRKYRISKGVTHQASAPGQPPSPFSGRLHDSISYQTNWGDKSGVGPAAKYSDKIGRPSRAMGGYVVSVGSNVPYALSLEKGSARRKLQSRPYLWPALRRAREAIKTSFTRV